jgi:Protein of unknown function (DUF2971)
MSSVDTGFIENQLEALDRQLKATWEANHAFIPNLLYHYTTADGLIGIINSRKMWASNISYLNDSSELSYASGLVRAVLFNKKDHTDSEVLREFIDRAEFTFNEFDWLSDVYITCFCEDGDLLSQWRGYGAMGGGYAIGFEAKLLEDCTPLREASTLRLRRAMYDENVQVDFIKTTINETCDLLLRIVNAIIPYNVRAIRDVIARFCGFLWDALSEFLFCFKHPTFAEEKEWRLAYKTSDYTYVDLVKFRGSRGSIIPYIELDLSLTHQTETTRLPINNIIHGPTLNPLLTEKSLRLLLMNKCVPLPEISSSSVPFRP